MGNYISPCWGFTVLLFTWVTTTILSCKELVKYKAEDHWGIGKPEDVKSLGKLEDVGLNNFWVLCKTDGLGEAGDEIYAKDRYIELDIALWFMLDRKMWNQHHIVFKEHIYYIIDDIQKPFKMGILKYTECVCKSFKWKSYSLLLTGITRSTMNLNRTPCT